MRISSVLHPYALPLIKPLRLVDATLTLRQGAIAELRLGDIKLYGDLCPLPTIHQETLAAACQQWQDLVVPVLALGESTLSERDLAPPAGESALAEPGFGLLPGLGSVWQALYPSVQFALESALLPWLIRQRPPLSYQADCAFVFYARGSDDWLVDARRAYSDGARLVKIKIGGSDWPTQKAAITTLLKDCPDIRLRLDANHQLTVEALGDPALCNWPIEFIEDGPAGTAFATAIDDGLWDIAPSKDAVAQAGVLVLKAARLRGLSGTWQWLRLAKRASRRAHLSSCYESGVGLWAQLILHQLAIEEFGPRTVLTPGFAPYWALKDDVLAPRFHLASAINLSAELKPQLAPAATTKGRCDLAAERWWQALHHDGLCLQSADGTKSYHELRAAVLGYLPLLDGPSQVWIIEATEPFAVWVAALACLISGHKLLPLYGDTPAAQREAWDGLCQHVTGRGLRAWPPQEPTGKAMGAGSRAPLQDGAVLIATSGSTGERKLAELSAAALYYSALGSNEFYGIDAKDRWGLCLPLFHVGGLMILLRAALAGAAAVPLAKRVSAADPSKLTMISLVPAQLSDILEDAPAPKAWAGLKAMVIGGAATSAALVARCQSHGLPLSLTYGMTESCSQLAATRPDRRLADSAMTVLPFRQVRLAGGLVTFTGAASFTGYIGQSSRDEWFKSQDLGEWTEAGALRILGRADRQIVKGGENIPLAAAEQAVSALGVTSYALPQDHPRLGQTYTLVIASQTAPAKEAIASALQTAMPKFWQPDAVIWLPLQQLSGIKLSAAEARAALAEAHSAGKKPKPALPLWP